MCDSLKRENGINKILQIVIKFNNRKYNNFNKNTFPKYEIAKFIFENMYRIDIPPDFNLLPLTIK